MEGDGEGWKEGRRTYLELLDRNGVPDTSFVAFVVVQPWEGSGPAIRVEWG